MKIQAVTTYLLILLAFMGPRQALALFDYSSLTLVDSVECATDTTHDFFEFTDNVSQVETVLGQAVRTLPNTSGDMKYFAYRLGAGKNLQADKGYILRIIYPEDQPRSMFILNRGCETARGFHTGRTIGDGLQVPYVDPNGESLELPLSGKMESWDMLFYLQERFPGLIQPRASEAPRDQTPEDGFLVLCLQLAPENDPLSAGVAIQRIELYETPELASITQPLATLPPGLPERHLFWREEMADGVVSSTDTAQRGYADDMTWYEQKFRLMNVLGMRTFAKDLLEFGANQGWDSSKYGGNSWVYQSSHYSRWSRIVNRCGELGFNVMPYYEYAGSKGSNGLGFEKRAQPLYGDGIYTHITWAETANVDITDPDTFDDFRKMLEITVVDEQEKAHFTGIWMRTRVTDLPISFDDAARARFEAEKGQTNVTRARLKNETALYDEYINWWYDKRRQFLEQVRDYLREHVHSEMDLLFTADSSETGKSRLSAHQADVVAEDPTAWNGTGATTKLLADAVEQNWQLQTLTNNWATWSYYEWQHSVPHPDPVRYKETPGIFMTETVNRAYTLEPDVMDAFKAKDGLAAIRHYSLNEDATTVGDERYLMGYFVADVDYAGPFVMLPEALAFAHGDPKYFGYLASHNFNRGNPHYVRRFNANFLALPALPSVIDSRFSAQADLVVRRIDTSENGTYLGAVHLGRTGTNLTLSLPEPGQLLDAVTGATISQDAQEISLEMAPYELRSFRFFPAASNTAPEIIINDSLSLEWFNALSTHGSWLLTELNPEVVDLEDDPISGFSWTLTSGTAEHVRIEKPTEQSTKIAFSAPGTYELTLSASDGNRTRNQPITINVTPQRTQIMLSPEMADYSETNIEDSGLFNNQSEAGDPPSGDLGSTWTTTGPTMYPVDFVVDMGQPYQLTDIWLLDYNGVGTFRVYTGSEASGWTNVVDCQTDTYKTWKSFELDQTSRYLKIERVDGGATIGELILFGKGGGLNTTDQIQVLPQKASLALDLAQNEVQLKFHINPLHQCQLNFSEDLESWTPIGTWSDTEPFPYHTQALTNQGFFQLLESGLE
ncbi:hypothetical protein P4C99_00150 [Pontiellaceae bacterium B1224]|nr:hypothetical protein [Pontiellaceae bacterium B1224]